MGLLQKYISIPGEDFNTPIKVYVQNRCMTRVTTLKRGEIYFTVLVTRVHAGKCYSSDYIELVDSKRAAARTVLAEDVDEEMAETVPVTD